MPSYIIKEPRGFKGLIQILSDEFWMNLTKFRAAFRGDELQAEGKFIVRQRKSWIQIRVSQCSHAQWFTRFCYFEGLIVAARRSFQLSFHDSHVICFSRREINDFAGFQKIVKDADGRRTRLGGASALKTISPKWDYAFLILCYSAYSGFVAFGGGSLCAIELQRNKEVLPSTKICSRFVRHILEDSYRLSGFVDLTS